MAKSLGDGFGELLRRAQAGDRAGARPLADLPEAFAASCRAVQAGPGVAGIRAVCFTVLSQEEVWFNLGALLVTP
jgi:hypothetical protein